MTTYLILDENIIILSAKVEDEQGNPDNTCTELISDILSNQDIIRVNVELFENYTNVLKSLESRIHSTSYTVKLLNLLRGAGSIHFWTSDLYELENEEQLPDDDIYLVRLAAGSRTDLVSTDSPLGKAMSDAKILTKYRIRFLEPQQVYS